jgi:hypothetical protein
VRKLGPLRFVCGIALIVFVGCGSDEEQAPASETPAAAVEPRPSGGAASDFEVDRTAELPDAGVATESIEEFDAEDRVGEILDTEPAGDGLDELIRAADEEPDASAREAAVIALGDSEDDRALDALVEAAGDDDERVVLAAIDQLSWFDEPAARDALALLAESRDAEIAAAAVEALEE